MNSIFCKSPQVWGLFTLHEEDSRGGTYICDMNQPTLMSCCVVQTLNCAGQRHDIRSIETLPTNHPNLASLMIGWAQLISQYVNVAGAMAWLCQDRPCGHEQTVQL